MKVVGTMAILAAMALLFGCSSVADQDLRNLSSENLATKRAALAAIAKGSISPRTLAADKKNEKEAVSAIQMLLNDEANAGDVELNLLGLAALGRLAEDLEIPVSLFLKKLESDNPLIRRRAVEILGKIGSPEAAPPLIEMSADDPDNYAIIWALGEIGGPQAVRTLNQMLTSNDAYVRYNAYNALSKATSSGRKGFRKENREKLFQTTLEKRPFANYKNFMSILFRKIGLLKKTWS